ncbi:MAG: PAS domain S-box protein, partial [Pseudomonadota bacterium]
MAISSPFLGFAIVVISAFLTEALIMWVLLPALSIYSLWIKDILDAVLLSISVSIFTFLLIVRPLIAANNALRLSESRLRSIFDLSTIGIAVADKNGLLHETNPAFQQMLGYSGLELTGLSWDQITHPDDIGHGATLIDAMATSWRAEDRKEKRYLHKSGAMVWGENHIAVARDHKGEIQFFTVLVEDITATREVDREQRLAAALFQTSAEAMVITDVDNRILKVNPSFTTLTGYTEDEAIGQNPKILSSGYHDRTFYAQLWTNLVRNGHWQGDLWNHCKDG